MNRRIQIIIWTVIFIVAIVFLRHFAMYGLWQQEDTQIFIPCKTSILDSLKHPGGFCFIAGRFLTQYYIYPLLAVIINAVIICSIGFIFFKILQNAYPNDTNILFALFPICVLLKTHTFSNYRIDGTIGILLMLIFVLIFLSTNTNVKKLILAVFGTAAAYILINQLVVLTGFTILVFCIIYRRKSLIYPALMLSCSIILTFIGIRYFMLLPITDGIYSMRYQLSQLQPESFTYFIWIRFSILTIILLFAAYLSNKLPKDKRILNITIIVAALFACIWIFRPNKMNLHDEKIGQLIYWERNEKWYKIIEFNENHDIRDYAGLNILNLALAKTGELGNSLFRFNQNGPQSLLVSWDKTSFSSKLLSDIHYAIGDYSLAESYAVEAQTLSVLGGSPSMLKRLAEISIIRNDTKLSEKYLNILRKMPYYNKWSEEITKTSLTDKNFPAIESDNLLGMSEIERLWEMHLDEVPTNRIATEYLGCSYLLSKEMTGFKKFLLKTANKYDSQPLPKHFQEAALLLILEDKSIPELNIRNEIKLRFKSFLTDLKKGQTAEQLYSLYGDTFWFYYYCKKIK